MTNFSPKLEDSSDEKLWQYVNQSSPAYGSLASDELTRRRLRSLEETMAKLEKSSSLYSKTIILLTIVLTVLAGVQIYIAIA